jgi:hypothetical protein
VTGSGSGNSYTINQNSAGGTVSVTAPSSLSLEKTGCSEGPWLSNNYPVALSGGPVPPDFVRVTPNPASDQVSLSLPATTASTPAMM